MSVNIRTANLSDYSVFYSVTQEVHEHHVEAIPDVFQSVDVVVLEDDFAQLVHGDDSDVYVAECKILNWIAGKTTRRPYNSFRPWD